MSARTSTTPPSTVRSATTPSATTAGRERDSASPSATPRRAPPPPAVKRTMGGIDTPSRSEVLSPGVATPTQTSFHGFKVQDISFYPDPRLDSTFFSMPVGGPEAARAFGIKE